MTEPKSDVLSHFEKGLRHSYNISLALTSHMSHICLGATDVTINTADKVPGLIGNSLFGVRHKSKSLLLFQDILSIIKKNCMG